MKIRSALAVIAGAALALDAATATAQAKSTRRIPISKEGGGEVVMPRVDTVMVYRTDTLRLFRTDTVTVTRVDTLRTEPAVSSVVSPVPELMRQIGGLYFGADLGAALPTGDLQDGQSGGPHFGLQVGWDLIGSPIGVRFDGSYSRFDVRSQFEQFASNPTIVQLGGDLKLRLPVLSPWMRRFQIYGVGGASYNRFKDIVEVNPGTGTVNVGETVNLTTNPIVIDHDWHGEWGWNAGGGLQVGWGRTNLFVESRFMGFSHHVDINQVPVVIGLSWF